MGVIVAIEWHGVLIFEATELADVVLREPTKEMIEEVKEKMARIALSLASLEEALVSAC